MDDDAYIEGHTACMDGWGSANCPYSRGTPEYEQWQQGFEAAMMDIEGDANDV